MKFLHQHFDKTTGKLVHQHVLDQPFPVFDPDVERVRVTVIADDNDNKHDDSNKEQDVGDNDDLSWMQDPYEMRFEGAGLDETLFDWPPRKA